MPRLEAALDDPDFQRAYLAVRYFAGVRGPELVQEPPRFHAAARAFATRLRSEQRTERAQALAVELERIVRSLDAQRLSR
jgi:hypothetical protein